MDYHPSFMYFDWWVGEPRFRGVVAEFAAFYYNQAAARHQHVMLTFKDRAMRPDSATLDIERGVAARIRKRPWQTATSVSNISWGYARHDSYKKTDQIIHLLADVVSKNGNLLLNFGPKDDGTIPRKDRHILVSIGRWLKVNGEAIYGTRPWTRFGEMPTKVVIGTSQAHKTKPYTPRDFRFTTKAGKLYSIEMDWPTDRKTLIVSLPTSMPLKRVTLLAGLQSIAFTQNAKGLHLRLPPRPPGADAYACRIDLVHPLPTGKDPRKDIHLSSEPTLHRKRSEPHCS